MTNNLRFINKGFSQNTLPHYHVTVGGKREVRNSGDGVRWKMRDAVENAGCGGKCGVRGKCG